MIVAVMCGVSAPLPAADDGVEEFIRASYTKSEYMVPMRDGVRLYTAVYVPRDAVDPRPVMMIRTPYACDPYGVDRYPKTLGPTADFARHEWIFVCQDVRGRMMSEGEFVNMRPHRRAAGTPDGTDESTDTWDTIEWLLAHVEGHNGRVGLWGNSYPGFYTSMGVIDSHPNLAAAMPSAPIADWFFDDMHHHGAFVLSLSFRFFSSFGVPREGPTTEWPPRFDFGTPDGYRFFLDLGAVANAERLHFQGGIPFWTEMADHPNYDEFWQQRSILPHLDGVTAAVMVVGGWFDAEDLYGPLHTYAALERRNQDADIRLVMGPWRHGAWLRSDGRTLGPADFGFPTAEVFRRRALVPFFEHHLARGPEPDLPEAWVFETGADRWREMDEWPPPGVRPLNLYLSDEGRLERSAPAAGGGGRDAFVSDPAKPVPYTLEINTGWHAEYMVEDQRFAAARPDVLVYRSEPLEDDVTVAGPLVARLWVSTTGGDADWIVKLIDEFPGRLPGHDPESDDPDLGHTQRMVRSEAFRGRFRNSYQHPEPFVPAEPTRVDVPLQDVMHTFRRGHRIMIQIQSTLFPFIDRNPQTWVDNIFEATEEDYSAETHTVWRTPELPSRIELSVLPRVDQP
jgi:putative CocE/NonD family hydrolase